ncbi:CYTH domain-containing protein [Bifidobacterium vespertilionis]|uniref:CYTH domain-containing protein n=1 Tax=Bifidobacterium vespertilionis TaxID=2562524 RepID=A0A5J5DVZ7_9BIFI|nr:hypothetical protein [Bifidobacterium vespertilionis]KAA8820883.1 hypothetical protein EMO90_05280 [Bifidobacterium vespertilionis]KAA8822731.1 hypothetical protein EM848_08410 [Bifidobacterium vespertilionis]
MRDDFEYERRFFCHELPAELDDGAPPILIVQSYYVHADNYALRIRLKSNTVREAMTPRTDAIDVLNNHRDAFSQACVTVKGPSVGGTRYEVEKDIDPDIAAELVLRGGAPIVKNRFNAWIGEDGWSIDVFGGRNAPLVVAEAERSSPVTNLIIPRFCVSEITDDVRFSNDGLAARPYADWAADYARELEEDGPRLLTFFGKNRREE